jgi:hypothetical protein
MCVQLLYVSISSFPHFPLGLLHNDSSDIYIYILLFGLGLRLGLGLGLEIGLGLGLGLGKTKESVRLLHNMREHHLFD